jgi:hypothetical protein
MPGDQLGHLKHADLFLAVEDGLQIIGGIDEGPLFGILQPVLADVNPKLFRQLGSRKGFVTNHCVAGVSSGVTGFMNAGLGVRFVFLGVLGMSLIARFIRGRQSLKDSVSFKYGQYDGNAVSGGPFIVLRVRVPLATPLL